MPFQRRTDAFPSILRSFLLCFWETFPSIYRSFPKHPDKVPKIQGKLTFNNSFSKLLNKFINTAFPNFLRRIPKFLKSFPKLLEKLSQAFAEGFPNLWRSYPKLLEKFSQDFGEAFSSFWWSYSKIPKIRRKPSFKNNFSKLQNKLIKEAFPSFLRSIMMKLYEVSEEALRSSWRSFLKLLEKLYEVLWNFWRSFPKLSVKLSPVSDEAPQSFPRS